MHELHFPEKRKKGRKRQRRREGRRKEGEKEGKGTAMCTEPLGWLYQAYATHFMAKSLSLSSKPCRFIQPPPHSTGDSRSSGTRSQRSQQGQSPGLMRSPKGPWLSAPQPPLPPADAFALILDCTALLQDEIGTRGVGTEALLDVGEGPVERTVAEVEHCTPVSCCHAPALPARVRVHSTRSQPASQPD